MVHDLDVFTPASILLNNKIQELTHAEPTDISFRTNSMESKPSENPPVAQMVKKFSAIYAARRFITVFTRARHWIIS
jgi:hypothetical protein